MAIGMTLDDLVTNVVDRTSRPDKTTSIIAYIRQAVNLLHTTTDYNRDVISTSLVNASGPQYDYDIDTSALTNFRKIKSVSYIDSDGNEIKQIPITHADITALLDYSGAISENVVYNLGGGSYRVHGGFPFYGVKVYYYAFPLMGATAATFNSWIADLYPWIIIDMATKSIKAGTGDDSSASMIQQDINTHLRALAALDIDFIH